MTIGKRKTRTRTKAKAKKRRVGTAVGTISIAGNTFKKAGCSRTKTDAKKMAESARRGGKNARVIASGTGYCVYTRSRTARKAA